MPTIAHATTGIVHRLPQEKGCPEEVPRNSDLAHHVLRQADEAGLDARLLDSDGRGGFHIWVVFAELVPMAQANQLGKWLIRNHEIFFEATPPEVFPKTPYLTGKRIGNAVRLPGKHPKRDHWTQVWCPQRRWWLQGEDAIRSLLSFKGRPVDLGRLLADRKVNDAVQARPAVMRRPVEMDDPDDPELRRQVALARSALGFLGDLVDDYDSWVMVGMSLAELDDYGLELWHAWSEQSDKYEPAVLDEKWRSFLAGDAGRPGLPLITLRTLFRLALDRGWDGWTPQFLTARRRPGFRATIAPKARRQRAKESHS